MIKSWSTPAGAATPWLIALACVVMIAGLLKRTSDVKAQYASHRADDERLRRGDFVPAFASLATNGDSLVLGSAPSGRTQIVIILTSTCPYCQATLPMWRALSDAVATDSRFASVDVIAVTTDSMHIASNYANAVALPFPLVPFPELRLLSLYRGSLVPQTVVVGHDGRVQYARHRVIETRAAIDSLLAAAVAVPRTQAARRNP